MSGPPPETAQDRTQTKDTHPIPGYELKIPDPTGNGTRAAGLEGDHAAPRRRIVLIDYIHIKSSIPLNILDDNYLMLFLLNSIITKRKKTYCRFTTEWTKSSTTIGTSAFSLMELPVYSLVIRNSYHRREKITENNIKSWWTGIKCSISHITASYG